MQNVQSPKQPPRAKDDSLESPHPPKQVELTPEAQEPTIGEVLDQETADDTATKNSAVAEKEKVQDYDWNNGKPEVTPYEVDELPSHKNPEVKNEEALRENKGTKPGEKVFNASEEVETGQNAG